MLDLLYPPDLYCICCRKIIDGTRTYRLCNDCMEGIKWIDGRVCVKCGKQLSQINPGTVCFSCREHPHEFDRGYTCTEYGTHERAIIFALKYGSRSDIAGTVGEILYDRMSAEFGADVLAGMYDIVLSVPVARSKQAVRGFNQAALIAGDFARRAGLNCDETLLIRTRGTRPMRGLTPDERRENIRGVFAVRPRRVRELAGKRVLLIDDIYTTGATTDEIARILKEPEGRPADGDKNGTQAGVKEVLPGASRVDVLTFAAGADVVKA